MTATILNLQELSSIEHDELFVAGILTVFAPNARLALRREVCDVEKPA